MARLGDFEILRQLYTGTYMANNGYDRETALARAKSGAVDLAAFYLEPDLVARLKAEAPLIEGDQATFCGGGDNGFTDDPTLELQAAE
ncbi:NADH-dependent flavin oxidoreductase Oye family [Ruegeria sp. TM1040]|nr:NADH-dependent flavin oxidoreductase Oye family [Ruegeria sp. TM1040]